MNSHSSHSKHATIGKKNILDMLKDKEKDRDKERSADKEKSEHISEVPAEIEESPLLPYSIRDKRRRVEDDNKF